MPFPLKEFPVLRDSHLFKDQEAGGRVPLTIGRQEIECWMSEPEGALPQRSPRTQAHVASGDSRGVIFGFGVVAVPDVVNLEHQVTAGRIGEGAQPKAHDWLCRRSSRAPSSDEDHSYRTHDRCSLRGIPPIVISIHDFTLRVRVLVQADRTAATTPLLLSAIITTERPAGGARGSGIVISRALAT